MNFTSFNHTTNKFWQQCQEMNVRIERNEFDDKRSTLSVGREKV